ncbi:MAG: tetratricopeptide repeat protein [Gemmatimonadales bacterium]
MGVSLIVGVGAAPLAAQQWAAAKCELKPGHQLVNSGVQYLKSASETKFEDKRQRDLKDAHRVLTQAVTTGGQEKNPTAWYYLGRFYAMRGDLAGADTALRKAAALAPHCQEDIAGWRRVFWVPLFNEGVKAWQAGNTDSAIASFRQANAIYDGEPTGFVYLATLFASREAPDSSLRQTDSVKYRRDSIVFATRPDSAAKYFKLAVPAARDTQYVQQKRDALFNVGRVYHAAQRWDEAAAGYKDYLAVYPSDAQAMAGLAAVYSLQDNVSEAQALYARILDHADSAEAGELFAAAQAMLNAVPAEPDTAPVGSRCRTDTRAKNRTLTVRQVAIKCQAATDSVIKHHLATIAPQYHLVARAYAAGLAKNPHERQALYNLGGIYYLLGDSAKVLPLAQRLYAVDPLNRTTLAKLAGAWQVKGNKDSTLYYLQVAEAIAVEVTVGGFTPDENGAKLDGLLTNVKSQPSSPTAITFEFLSPKGDVVASQKQDVPALDASSNQAFEIKVTGAGIVAWRYRKS